MRRQRPSWPCRRSRPRAWRQRAALGGQQLTKITFQSKWVVQSQFAGYYVAQG